LKNWYSFKSTDGEAWFEYGKLFCMYQKQGSLEKEMKQRKTKREMKLRQNEDCIYPIAHDT